MHSRIPLLALLLACTSIQATAASVHPRRLQQLTPTTVHELKAKYFHDRVTSRNKEYIRHTVLPGTYIRAFTDGEGDYYLGADDCMKFSIFRLETGSEVYKGSFNYDCGFYLPHNADLPVRLFYVTGTLGPGPAKAPRIDPNVNMDIAARSVTPSGAVTVESTVGGIIGGLIVNAIAQSGQGRFKFVKSEPDQPSFDRSQLVAGEL